MPFHIHDHIMQFSLGSMIVLQCMLLAISSMLFARVHHFFCKHCYWNHFVHMHLFVGRWFLCAFAFFLTASFQHVLVLNALEWTGSAMKSTTNGVKRNNIEQWIDTKNVNVITFSFTSILRTRDTVHSSFYFVYPTLTFTINGAHLIS